MMKRLIIASIFAVAMAPVVASAQEAPVPAPAKQKAKPAAKKKAPVPPPDAPAVADPCAADPCAADPNDADPSVADPNVADPTAADPNAVPPADEAAPVEAVPAEPVAPTPAPAPAVVEPAPVETTAVATEPEAAKKKGSDKFLSGGLQVGGTLATVTGTDINFVTMSDPGFKVGAAAGGFLTLNVHKYVSLQGELNFASKGSSTDGGTFRLNYLDMPLLIKAKIPMAGKIHPNIHVGPVISHVQLSKVELEGRNVNLKENEEVNILDVGVAAGAGANYALSVGEVSADLRFQQGFRNVIDRENCGNCGQDTNIKTRTLLLLVGYVFP